MPILPEEKVIYSATPALNYISVTNHLGHSMNIPVYETVLQHNKMLPFSEIYGHDKSVAIVHQNVAAMNALEQLLVLCKSLPSHLHRST